MMDGIEEGTVDRSKEEVNWGKKAVVHEMINYRVSGEMILRFYRQIDTRNALVSLVPTLFLF
ncbi:MAG: hypothetical protein ACI9R3_006424 [Verrucomicrobiales bacterium]|jgi:hypothetical protein